MTVATGDFLQLIARQLHANQQILNVFYYKWIATGQSGVAYLTNFMDTFETNIRFNLLGVQATSLTWTGLSVRNLTNGIDLAERAYDPAIPGSIAGDHMPPFVTNTFRLNRVNLLVRNGYKRFGGVPEAHQNGGISSMPTANQTNIKAALLMDLPISATPSLRPVILRRPLPLLVPQGHAHSEVGSVDFRGIGSQNTRKFGRGI